MDSTGAPSSTYEEFVNALPEDECRYGGKVKPVYFERVDNTDGTLGAR